MKTSTAVLASELVRELDNIHTKQDQFHKTKEFCQIHLKGEDGTEREYQLHLHRDLDRELVDILRTQIEAYLYTTEGEITERIEAL